MTTKIAMWTILAVVGTIVRVDSAFALVQKTVPANTISFLGMVGGGAKLVSQPLGGGACSTQTITLSGALTDSLLVKGTTGSDRIYTAPSGTTTFCGMSITKLLTGGYNVVINGLQGNDVITGDTIAEVNGHDGNDLLRSELANKIVWGGGGTDLVATTATTVTLSGEDGDDAHCAWSPSSHTKKMDGGPSGGYDTRCGTADSYVNIDAVDCLRCAID